MNRVVLIGRLTADPELRYTSSEKAFTRFTLAVNRDYKKENGETDADFISVVAWEQLAETINKYVKKGHKICVEGKIQTGSYDKEDGSKGYLTDVVINHLEFLEKKQTDEKPAPDYVESTKQDSDDPFTDFGNNVQLTDNDLPF